MKNLLLFLPVFIWFQACSQSPNPVAADKSATTILNDTTGKSLGNSPDGGYRLFKFPRQVGDQTVTELKLLQFKDMQETTVGTITPDALTKAGRTDPRVYWSKDGHFLITENIVPDSSFDHEVVLFSLQNFKIQEKKPGALLGFDLVNDIAFFYLPTAERQQIRFFEVKNPGFVQQREIIAPPSGKLPILILAPTEKKAKVKAYTTDGVPINVSIQY